MKFEVKGLILDIESVFPQDKTEQKIGPFKRVRLVSEDTQQRAKLDIRLWRGLSKAHGYMLIHAWTVKSGGGMENG